MIYLKRIIKNNSFFYSFFCLILLFVICASLILINFSKTIIEENNKQNENSRTFLVSTDKVDIERKLELLVNDNISSIYCIIENNNDLILAYYKGIKYNKKAVCYGKWFSDYDLKDGTNKIILPNYPYFESNQDINLSKYEIGDSYYIDSKEYLVIGIGILTEPFFQIPYNSITDDMKISYVGVIYNSVNSNEEIEHNKELLESLFNGKVIQTPEEVSKMNFFEVYLKEIFFISLISLLILSVLVYLYNYILNTRKNEFIVKRVYDKSILKVVFSLLLELVLLVTVSYFIGLGIYFVFVRIMSKWNMSNLLYLFDYVNVYLIYLLIISILFVPIILKFKNKSITELLQDSGE